MEGTGFLRSRWASMLGMVLYGATGALYLVSGLVAPPLGVLVLWALWLAGLVIVGMAAYRRSPWVFLGLPVAVAVWYLVLFFGDVVFGWTA